MFSKLIGSNSRKAEISRKERRLKRLTFSMGWPRPAARRFCLPRERNTSFASAIATSLGWDGLIASMAEANSVVRP